jgi:hypothetical protein
MSQTLTSLLAHLVFSSKNLRPIITPEIEPELFAYMGGILKNYESRLLDAGGTEQSSETMFKEELLPFLDAYGIDYDERYLWNLMRPLQGRPALFRLSGGGASLAPGY